MKGASGGKLGGIGGGDGDEEKSKDQDNESSPSVLKQKFSADKDRMDG